MSNQEKAAQVIYDALSGKYGDFRFPTDAAEALADAGLLAPDLPEPDTLEYGSPEWDGVFAYQYGAEWRDAMGSVCAFNGTVEVQGDDTHIHTPDEARALALALLAAANHAEKENNHDQ